MPPRGSPPLQSGGQNQKWPTSEQGGYITPAASGIPTASKRGAKSEMAHEWARWLHHPCRLGDPHRLRGAKSEVAHKWAWLLHHPCRLGYPRRFKAGGKIRSGPQVGEVATSPMPPRGYPPLQSGGWPINGNGGYSPAALGIPTASKRGAKSEVAHKWARWLHHPFSGIPTASKRWAKSEVAHKWARWLHQPCRLGDRFKAGGKIRSGP